jgi:hypothetical protein
MNQAVNSYHACLELAPVALPCEKRMAFDWALHELLRRAMSTNPSMSADNASSGDAAGSHAITSDGGLP